MKIRKLENQKNKYNKIYITLIVDFKRYIYIYDDYFYSNNNIMLFTKKEFI